MRCNHRLARGWVIKAARAIKGTRTNLVAVALQALDGEVAAEGLASFNFDAKVLHQLHFPVDSLEPNAKLP